VELGSGTGLAGLAAAAILGYPTTLTDLPEVLPSLRANVHRNTSLSNLVKVAACDWLQPIDLASMDCPHGLILAADVVWLEPLVNPLVSTLTQIAQASGPYVRVLLAYQSRSRRVDEILFNSLAEQFYKEEAPLLPSEPDRGAIQLYWLRLRSPSSVSPTLKLE